MRTHAAFLRAVNLGATRKAPSAKLVEIFEALGFEDVATFRTSGNVVFRATGSDAKLRSRIEEALEKGLGFEVPTFVRTARELKAIAEHTSPSRRRRCGTRRASSRWRCSRRRPPPPPGRA